jgi:hypothetical protein
MKTNLKINFYLIFFLASLLFYLPTLAHAATLELSLSKDIVSPKDDIVVLVTINSENQEINTAQATVSFPANLLEVTKIDHIGSVFSFWLQEPIFDNAKGSISFVGGSTSGFNGASLKLMQISFKVKGSGTGRLGITDGAITASDGTGSNVYTTSKGLDINIPATADFQAVKIERALTLAKQLPLLALEIPFFPDPTKWNNRSASFQATWNIGSDIIKAGIVLDKNPNTIPKENSEALLGRKVFPVLEDGISYLHLRVSNNIGWSPTVHYRLAVDTTPPTPFKIISKEGFTTIEPRPTINFISSDLTSGIDNYVIYLDGKLIINTNLTEYKFSPLPPGKHQLSIRAVDKAGNSTSQTETLEILPITSPIITYVSRKVTIDDGNITAGGTASTKGKIIIQIQNEDKQIVFEDTVNTDTNGNWNILINKTLTKGDYNLLAIAEDENMALSFPVVSETISVRPKPMLVLGSLELTQVWFFVYFIIVLLGAFGAGYFSYHNWRGKLNKRVIIAERDVLNILDLLNNDVDKLMKDNIGGNFDESKKAEIEYTLKNIKNNLEKSRHYVVDNISEIDN